MTSIRIYSTCVGHFKEPSESTKVLRKLNSTGYKGFLFSMGDYYTLKVMTTPDPSKAANLQMLLTEKGFDSFVC